MRKVGEGRVRLFESELVPGRFLRALPDGSADCQARAICTQSALTVHCLLFTAHCLIGR